VYLLARPPWRVLKRLLFLKRTPNKGYWEKRRHFNYYREVIRLASTYEPSGQYVIDVGAHDTEVLLHLAWFEHRVVLDLRHPPRRKGIESIVMDFMDYRPTTYFDLVLCLQVLEHVKNPDTFAQKLLKTGRTVIISVPYKWPRGLEKSHKQDPVDEAKLERWTQQTPVETRVINDERDRLIAVYQSNDERQASHRC
jgi:hypothetical protein